MDALDRSILREIGVEPFASRRRTAHPWRPETLATVVGAPARLVKDRLARLEREGIVAGYDVYPNLLHLGLEQRTYAFAYAERAARRAVLDRLARVEGVVSIVDYVTDWLNVTFAYATEEEHARRLGEVRAILGGIEPATWFELELPKTERVLSRLDLRILRALRGDARRPVHELADAVGVTRKTIQRRLDALAEDGSLSVFALIGDRAQDELLLCTLVLTVEGEPATIHAGMHKLHGEVLADAWARCSAPLLQDGVHYDLVSAPRSPRGLAELLERVAKVPGVRDVRGHLAAGVAWSRPWLDAELDRRIAAAPPS